MEYPQYSPIPSIWCARSSSFRAASSSTLPFGPSSSIHTPDTDCEVHSWCLLSSDVMSLGFYTGLTPSLMSIVPNMGLNFMIFEYCKKQLCHISQCGVAPDIIHSTCGAISGGMSKFITYPFDTIKKRIQQQVLYNTSTLRDDCPSRYRGVADCAMKLWKQEGIRGFYKVVLWDAEFVCIDMSRELCRQCSSRLSPQLSHSQCMR